MRHVPRGARPEWACTSATAIQAACQSPEEEDPWLCLYILARCVLVARPGEQGTAGGRSAAQRVKEACFQWRAGEEALLWKEATGEAKQQRRGRRRKAKQAPAPTLAENNASRAKTLAQEGQAKALVSLGMELNSEEALQETPAKHPRAEPNVVEEAPETAPITVTPKEVGEAIKSFRSG